MDDRIPHDSIEPGQGLRSAAFLSTVLATTALALSIASAKTDYARPATQWREESRVQVAHVAELFGRKYSLDDKRGIAEYVKALDLQIARSKREEPLGEAHKKDPVHNKLPRNSVDKKIRKSMETARKVAADLLSASGERRSELKRELWTIAGAINGVYARVLPPNMDVFEAMARADMVKHPRVGLGNRGIAANLSGASDDPSQCGPKLPSPLWNDPGDISQKNLYCGFGRKSIPKVDNVIFTYRGAKESFGVHGGFDVKSKELGKGKFKFGEECSQPFAHRIAWALGFNTTPVDFARTVKVKWDRRILTEFNCRRNEVISVRLFGLIPIVQSHLQRYLDPFEPIAEIVMLDEHGNDVTLKPNPTWEEFKAKLFKRPHGRPESAPDNFNDDFAGKIKYLVYKNVNYRPDGEPEDEEESNLKYIGNWDWNGEDTPDRRENRAFVFLSAWLSQFDTVVHNNKLYMTESDGKRVFKQYVTDLGGCLGPADDATKMIPQDANRFPWSFTRPVRAGEARIPLEHFHNILKNRTCEAADLNDAKWMARYIARLSDKQILGALVASGFPSAKVRIFYNKLVSRRNKALSDLGLVYPPIERLDASEEFDYDPKKDGLMKFTTDRGEVVSAPDDGWIVMKGRVYSRTEVESGAADKDLAKALKHKKR